MLVIASSRQFGTLAPHPGPLLAGGERGQKQSSSRIHPYSCAFGSLPLISGFADANAPVSRALFGRLRERIAQRNDAIEHRFAGLVLDAIGNEVAEALELD